MQKVRVQCVGCKWFLPVYAQVTGYVFATIQKSLQAREREVFKALCSFSSNGGFLSLVSHTQDSHLHSRKLMAAESS